MSATLEDYRRVAGSAAIDELVLLAERVRHRRLQHINSTSVGGGVAELLTRLVPLFRDLGIETTWDVMKGDQAFFEVTKAYADSKPIWSPLESDWAATLLPGGRSESS